MSKVSLPPDSDPTAEMDFEELENNWEADGETDQERIVHNIKVTKA